MPISEQLRRAIEKSPETYYKIAKEADVDWGTLTRFVDSSRPNIRIDTIDRLCAYLGLELRPKPIEGGANSGAPPSKKK